MTLDIQHNTVYTYSKPIFPEPHYLHFCPQNRHYIDVLSFELEVNPVPVGLSSRIDAEGNTQHQCWFGSNLNELTITSRLRVETEPFNPFDFYIEASQKPTSMARQNPVLIPYLHVDQNLSPELEIWIDEINKESGDNPLTLITHFNTEISTHWDHSPRYTSDLHSPETCYTRKTGSCRDLSWMMMIALRHCGMPTRFVSGYAYNPELGEGHELHAWVEAWIAGAGWVAVDPSAGLFTSQVYIPVASSYDPLLAKPVLGSYRGDAESKLSTQVMITML